MEAKPKLTTRQNKLLHYHWLRIYHPTCMLQPSWVKGRQRRRKVSEKYQLILGLQRINLTGLSSSSCRAGTTTNWSGIPWRVPGIDMLVKFQNLRQHVNSRNSSQTKEWKSERRRSNWICLKQRFKRKRTKSLKLHRIPSGLLYRPRLSRS